MRSRLVNLLLWPWSSVLRWVGSLVSSGRRGLEWLLSLWVTAYVLSVSVMRLEHQFELCERLSSLAIKFCFTFGDCRPRIYLTALIESLEMNLSKKAVVLKDKAVSMKDKAAVTALLLIGSASAFAQTTDGDTTTIGVAAINALKTSATSYITAAFGVAVLCAGGWWGIGMLKKAVRASK